MANGKIVYTPLTTVGLTLDGAHYLSLDDGSFNPGTGHLGVDFLGALDPTVADSECWLAAKGASSLASAAGWHIYCKPASRRLGLRLNDGGVTPLAVETADNQLPVLGQPFWARVEVDRTNDLARFYVNGSLVASQDISAITGSLNNSELLRVGAYDASTNRFKGRVDLLRFDLARLLAAAWHEQEWYRLYYGCPRQAQDFLAVWTFYGESLIDISANAFELTWQGGGNPAFETGWPGSAGAIAYPFADNFEIDFEPGHLDLDDNQRMADGSAYNYPHPNQKKTYVLPFKHILPAQQSALVAAWAAKQPIDLCLDADLPKEEGQFQIMKYPLLRHVFSSRMDAELDLEQV